MIKIKDCLLKYIVETPDHDCHWCSWYHFKNGTRCIECYYEKNKKIKWDLESAKEKFAEYELEMIDERMFVNSHKRIPCRMKDGMIVMANIHYLVNGRTDFSPWKNNPYAYQNIKTFCKVYRPDYEIVSTEYKGSHEIHTWKYIGDYLSDETDPVFDMKFGNFVNSFCNHPALSLSKIELKMLEILDKYKFNYTTQKTFDECVDKIHLRYDFYLNDYNVCIETDGWQHDMPIEIFGGQAGYEDRKRKDEIKNIYCEKHNIGLLRLKEKDSNRFEQIFIDYMKEVGYVKEFQSLFV